METNDLRDLAGTALSSLDISRDFITLAFDTWDAHPDATIRGLATALGTMALLLIEANPPNRAQVLKMMNGVVRHVTEWSQEMRRRH